MHTQFLSKRRTSLFIQQTIIYSECNTLSGFTRCTRYLTKVSHCYVSYSCLVFKFILICVLELYTNTQVQNSSYLFVKSVVLYVHATRSYFAYIYRIFNRFKISVLTQTYCRVSDGRLTHVNHVTVNNHFILMYSVLRMFVYSNYIYQVCCSTWR